MPFRRGKVEIKIKFCPNCGESLQEPASLLNEFWVSSDTAYFCWCSFCEWKGEIIEVTRITAPELVCE
jgi:hypothetical protein